MKNIMPLIIMMGLVTYLPRMLPMVLLRDAKLNPFLKSFLKYIPFAVLGALIFPGILNSTGNINSALVGGTVSVILALLGFNLMVVVFGGILGVYLFNLIMF